MFPGVSLPGEPSLEEAAGQTQTAAQTAAAHLRQRQSQHPPHTQASIPTHITTTLQSLHCWSEN